MDTIADNKIAPVGDCSASGDPFAWWRYALDLKAAGKKVEFNDGVVNVVQWGYWRAVDSNLKRNVPVSSWYEGTALVCLWNGEEIKADTAIDRWTFFGKNPITEEEYQKVSAGGHWSDIDPTVAAVHTEAAGAGHNNPPAETENTAPVVPWEDVVAGLRRKIDSALLEAKPTIEAAAADLKKRIEAAVAGVAIYKGIASDETQVQAQTLRAHLLELKSSAVKAHDVLKRPHIDEGKRIDTTWNGLANMADGGAQTLRKEMNGWERVKFDRAAEETRLANEAAANLLAEQQQEALEAQAEADRAIADGTPPSMQEPPPVVAPEPKPAPVVAAPYVPAPIKGASGRSAGVQMVKKGTITDQDKVYTFFRTRASVIEALQSLVNSTVKSGFLDIPGVTVTEEPDVR